MPNHRPAEPIAPATIPGQPLDPKIPPDQQGSETRPRDKKIPDRSSEPAVRESLDPERSKSATNSSNDAAHDSAETRDDEGNVIAVRADGDGAPRAARPDSDAGSQ